MTTRSHTDHTKVTFTLKETVNNGVAIMIEDDGPGLPFLHHGAFLMLRFGKEVSFDAAERFKNEMNRMFDTLNFTTFDT